MPVLTDLILIRSRSILRADIDRIMDTPSVIRSRRKIEAVIGNAHCVRQIRKEFGSFSDYLWDWTNRKMLLYQGHELGNIPASNELSDRISEDLKKRGLKYIGSVTVYAHLQACGIINDHIKECARYQQLIDQYDAEIVEQ